MEKNEEFSEVHKVHVRQGFYHDETGAVSEATRSERLLYAMVEFERRRFSEELERAEGYKDALLDILATPAQTCDFPLVAKARAKAAINLWKRS